MARNRKLIAKVSYVEFNSKAGVSEVGIETRT
jgi:hypothetical protein